MRVSSRAGSVLMAVMLAFGAAIPAAAVAQPVPPYARPAPAGAETIHGTIAMVQDAYHITVNDDRGFVDFITLRQGTVIAPRGLRLRPGMRVAIVGFAAGNTFIAEDIEAPGEFAAGYADAYPYGYGYSGYDWWSGATLLDVGTSIITQPAPAGGEGTPQPRRRGIEPPNPNMPVQRVPLDAPSYRSAMPANRAAMPDARPGSEQARPAQPQSAPQPQYHAPPPAAPQPQYHAPPPAPPPPPPPPPPPARSESRSPESHPAPSHH